jgi:hypothetical protein
VIVPGIFLWESPSYSVSKTLTKREEGVFLLSFHLYNFDDEQ